MTSPSLSNRPTDTSMEETLIRKFGSDQMTKSAAAAGGDHRRLLVRLNRGGCSGGKGNGNGDYLCGISSEDFSKTNEYIDLPNLGSGTTANSCGGLIYFDHPFGEALIVSPQQFKRKTLPPTNLPFPESKCGYLRHFRHYDACCLGFDSRSNDYKVVRFMTNCYEPEDEFMYPEALGRQIEVYSLQKNGWYEVIAPHVENLLLDHRGVCVNNKCYWLGGMKFKPKGFVSFDLENDSVSELVESLPDGGENCAWQLFEYKGHLAVVGFDRGMGPNRRFQLWIMKKEYAKWADWEKVFDVMDVDGVRRPVGFGKNYEAMFLEGYHGDMKGHIAVVDLSTGDLKVVPNIEHNCNCEMYMFSYSCESIGNLLRDEMPEDLIMEEGLPGFKDRIEIEEEGLFTN